jgi:hypothetical protein
MSANEPQTLRNEYSRTTIVFDAEYKYTSASLDDVIKTCENLHVEEIINSRYHSKNMNILHFLMEN